MSRKHLVGLDPHSYEHPKDRIALNSLRGSGILESAVSALMNSAVVRWDVVKHRGHYFHVTESSCPELYSLFDETVRVLDVADYPKLYVLWDMGVNGYTWGYKETTMIEINSGVVDLMSPMEQAFVVGHELGHIKSRHVIYHTLTRFLGILIPNIPLFTKSFEAGLRYWDRMSEFTADRAGLLACQDVNAALKAIVKMSGIPQKYFDQINVDEFLREAKAFESEMGGLDNFVRNMINMFDKHQNHPWTLLRALELKRWIDSGEYEAIINANAGKLCPICGTQNHKDATECVKCGYAPLQN